MRISRDLHDGPIQDLYGVSLFLETFREYIQEPDQAGELQEIMGNITAIISSLREICGELRPPVLEQFGLERAIRAHLNRIREKHPELNVEARLVSDGLLLSERTRLALFRVYQTAISNVLRHARASQVRVEFRLDNGQIHLKIRDNGSGFQLPGKWVDLARDGHFGLVGMAERVESMGGQLKIESQVGQGTAVTLMVPMETPERL
jgi:two-component system sensor histidine kinase DegS